ncbi:interleukin-22 receptor subunit alpha-2 isoform X2 [Boleophthalmus pectinirostris]|uniref:interleukin-22 receptor subunit alpha-2 isoform X2 n=1 Tax=Boleophthalmus pectinirostris TaxID=150288 RepID=UPI00242FEDF9|nr:interleukin-22 receptor subunit alpha-2 isoform X2 [Boleophthalmus pectinirostris]
MINMTALLLLWAAVLLGTIGGGFTEEEGLLPPAHLRFDSVDYKTTVAWTPSSNSSSLKYNVQWKIYGEPQWVNVDDCQGIEKPKCDLSEVTSDITEWYYARVQATSPAAESTWAVSRRFSPRWDSQISPPLLRLNTTQKGIVVRVKPPRAQVRKKHSDLYYKIYLLKENGQEMLLLCPECFTLWY